MRRLYVTMRVCGVVHLRNAFATSTLNRVRRAQSEEIKRFKASREEREEVFGEEWTDAASRSVGRYEVRFPLKDPFIDPEFVTNRFIMQLSKCLLSNR